MTGLPPIVREDLRRALRENGARFINRFWRRELLLARTVRGMQVEAQQEFDREIIRPLLRVVGGNLSGFELRGNDIIIERFPQLAGLEREIAGTVEQGSDAVRRVAIERLDELTRQEADFVDEAARDVGVETTTPGPPVDVIERPFLGERPEEWFRGVLDTSTGDTVRSWVQTGLQRGLTTDEIVRGIRGTRAEAGILEAPRNNVATLVRTAASHASAQARMDSFEGIGVDEWQFVATLDLRTSEICASNDGKVFKVGEGPVPPLHPNCRSTAVPWFGEDLGGTRASVDGQVASNTTYQQWLKDQPAADQDRMLGKRKAAAWRRGDLTFEQMVGRDLQPLTLAELERLDRI